MRNTLPSKRPTGRSLALVNPAAAVAKREVRHAHAIRKRVDESFIEKNYSGGMGRDPRTRPEEPGVPAQVGRQRRLRLGRLASLYVSPYLSRSRLRIWDGNLHPKGRGGDVNFGGPVTCGR